MFNALQQFWRVRQREINAKWNRTLPLGDCVVDRWEKASVLGFGKGASIYDSAIIIGKVTVGEKTWIGPNVMLDGSGGLEIGAYCSISAGVQIYSHDSVAWALSGGQEPNVYQATKIGSRCYVGPMTIVAKGVVIGDGSVIGAHSLVLKDIPAGSKCYGVPCRVVGASNLISPPK